MHKIRVAVLRGGPSIISHHLPEHYHPVDIFIDKNGVWHQNGVPVIPSDTLKHVDAVFIDTHHKYGKIGAVQRILETFGIPYTGSDSLGSALGMNKVSAKKIFKSHAVKSPYH